MRAFYVVVHRWVGLFIAAFLIVTGLTGAVISWDHELDEWLNPHLTDAHTVGTPKSVLDIIKEVEARYPTMQVLHTPLAVEAGHSLDLYMEPRVNADTGELYPKTFNQVFVDPVSGEELGKREWGAVWPITKENLVSFLYVLHYSLHIPEFWGIDRWGLWLLGIVALVWTLDCFVSFYLTLPVKRRNVNSTRTQSSWFQRWKSAWKIRWSGGSYKLNFDLHQAVSLWAWALLFILAFTAFSLNLYREVFFPVMSLVSDVTPTPYDKRVPQPENKPIIAQLSFTEALDRASELAQQRNWDEPLGSVFYARHYGFYSVAFYHPEDEHGAGGVGHKELYVDAMDGRELGVTEPWKGTAADIFVQAQFPLHSGRILGVPGRILISVMGLVVAMLSVTGVIIWWRKRKARLLKEDRSVAQGWFFQFLLKR
ncbi:MAG: PepSY domain-containing protein [Spongiibacteraceae bacterium]|nr:PepSY domain-containing protein [Spongiibacteraceae bacterium]